MKTADRILYVVKHSGVQDRQIRSTLAKLRGISPQAVRDWFEGKTTNIRHEHLKAIAKEYSVTIDWLLTGEGDYDQIRRDSQEEEILAIWRALPQSSRDLVLVQARAVLEAG